MAGSASSLPPSPGLMPRTHRVRSGDTLPQLAMDYDVSLESLVTANRIQDARLLWIGQVLTIPRADTTAGMPKQRMESSGDSLAQGGKKDRPEQTAASSPPEDEDVNDLGIVCWDGTPALRLRSSPSTKDNNIIGSLPFSTILQVVKRLPDKWLHVSTRDGRTGYVSADYVWLAPYHPLPEPNVRLHRVAPDLPGTAIAIAEHYFETIQWGQDLRFYVTMLALVNKRPIPRSVQGWKELRFQAGELIWVPSQEFAEALRGRISSGSYTYEAAAELVVARALERLGQLQADFRKAIRLALRHIGPAVQRHVEESVVSILTRPYRAHSTHTWRS
jgi:LysM repeat protein